MPRSALPGHPFATLPAVSRRQASLTDAVAAALPVEAALVLPGLEAAVGVEVEASLGAPGPRAEAVRSAVRCSERVVLEHAATAARAVLEVDAPLALGLVSLALCREVAVDDLAPRPLDRVEQGVLVYLVARALWGARGPGVPLRVAGIVPEGRDPVEVEVATTVPVGVRAGSLMGHGWLHLPRGFEPLLAAVAASERRRAPPIGRLEGLLFGLHVVAGQTELALSDWAGARVGDAILVDDAWCRPSAEGWAGEARLRFAWGRSRWRARPAEDGSVLTVTGWACEAEGGTMTDHEAGEGRPFTPEDVLAELPLALTVELGRIALTAQQALELQPGQTLLLGRRPGDPVELRAGAKLLARGDLVDVEGELGVRLVEIYPDRAP